MDDPVVDKPVHDLAVKQVCHLFDTMGLSLWERWHVCENIEMACLSMMGEHAREAVTKVRDKDLEKVREGVRSAS